MTGKYNEIYDILNNAGCGYAVGAEDDDINELTDLGELIHPAETDNDVAVYQDGNDVTIVGDSHGPWGVNPADLDNLKIDHPSFPRCGACGTTIYGEAGQWIDGTPYCRECVKIGI